MGHLNESEDRFGNFMKDVDQLGAAADREIEEHGFGIERDDLDRLVTHRLLRLADEPFSIPPNAGRETQEAAWRDHCDQFFKRAIELFDTAQRLRDAHEIYPSNPDPSIK